MANEVTIRIKVKDESAAGYAEALAAAREFGAKVKEEIRDAGMKAGDEAGDAIKRELEETELPDLKVGVDTEEAKAELDEVKHKADEVAHEDPKINVDVDAGEALAELEVVKHEAKEAGKDSGGGFGKNFQSALGKLDFKPSLMSVGSSVAAAFAPLIAGAIAGAVVGAIGLGGIVGGVALAAKDPRVKSGFDDLKHDLGDSLKIDAAPFVPVVLSGIKQVQAAFHQVDFAGIFKDLAPQVQPLLSGVLDMLVDIGNSIKTVVANSGPVIAELGQDFRGLGRTLADSFASLSKNTDGEVSALHDLFAIVDGGVRGVFALVNALTETYNAFHKLLLVGNPLVTWQELYADRTDTVTGSIKRGLGVALSQVEANKKLAGSASGVAAANKKEADSIAEVSDALKAATDPVWALQSATSKLTSAQGKYNSALKAHGANSRQAKAAQQDLEQALVEYIGAASKARSGTSHLTDEQKALLRSAGASSDTIKDLDNKLAAAYNQAKKLDGFNVDITVTQHFRQTGKYISQSQIDNPQNLYSGLAHGGISGAASGATSSGLTWVGERGPELIQLPPGTSVHTAGDSQRVVDKYGNGGGTTQVLISPDYSRLNGVVKAIMQMLRAEVANQGGSVQHVLGSGIN